MSGKFVRASKYRHVFGQPAKKELCYENLKITKNAWDSNIIACNGKYLSVNWDASGGGAFAIIPLHEVGKAPDKVPLFRGHTGPVLDTVFSPFDKQQVVSCSDDGRVCVWEIPENFSFHHYVDENDEIKDVTQPKLVLKGHTRKVGHAEYHPCAENILATSSLDYTVKIWNLATGKDEITLQHKDLVTSFCFNHNGTLLATTSRDKKLRIWDIRKGTIVSEGPGHTGAKPSRVVWLGSENRIVTTGFSRLSDRQVGIWDAGNIAAGPIDGFLVVDSSSGVLIPYYDECNRILYLAGKGDGNIRYYEYENDYLHDLSQYSSTDPQRGFAAAPKMTVNVKENEVLRAFKTSGDNSVEPISFIVPRRSELFQSDIYPDCPSDKPALSADEWLGGKTVPGPLLMEMESLYDGTEPEIKEYKREKEEKKVENEEKVESEENEEEKVENENEKELYQSPKTNIDDLLKTNDKVNSLLSKVSDDKDHDEEVEDGQDDEWEEEKKEKGEEEEKEEKEKEEEQEIEEKKEEIEKKKEEVEKIEKHENHAKEAPEDTKEASETNAKVSSDVSKTATDAQVSAVKAENVASVNSSPIKSNGPTLKATVERLAGLVVQLESQVAKLVEAGLEKDERLAVLEGKIEELLKR